MSSIAYLSGLASQSRSGQGIINHAVPNITYHIQTLWLFIKSDISTTVMPVVVFAVFITNNTSPTRTINAFIWTTLNLLQCCVSNQSFYPEEDAKNKPWRPIPAGRISVKDSITLRWTLLPICLGLSATFGGLDGSILLSMVVFLYNDCGYNAHWFSRTILNAFGYSALDIGAVLILLGDPSKMFDRKILLPLVINSSVIFTTVHAQDFRDLIGDIQEGRKTIPIILPRASRVSMPVLMVAWAIVLLAVHEDWNIADWVVLLFGAYVGLRFYFIREACADQLSYTMYNIWLTVFRVALALATSAGPKDGDLN